MNRLFFVFFFLIPLLLYGKTNYFYIQKIEEATTKAEKELVFLEWVDSLSQHNILMCDSIINNSKAYLKDLSDDGQLRLFLLSFNNARLSGSEYAPQLKDIETNTTDALLMKTFIRYGKGQSISKKEFENLSNLLEMVKDPIRRSMFYMLATCVEGNSTKDIIHFYNLALKQAEYSSLKSCFSIITSELSKFYVEIEDFEQAIDHHQKGAFYSRDNGLKANLINHFIEMGRIHLQLDNIEKSEANLVEALTLSLDSDLEYVKGQLFNLLGEIYSVQRKIPESIRYFQQSLLQFYKVDNEQGLAAAHKNIGKAYFINGDVGLAEKNYLLSEVFFKQLEHNENIGELYYLMAELYLSTDRLALAEKNIKRSIEYWQAEQLFIPLNEAYYLYAKIKNQQGHFQLAYSFLERYIVFHDSINDVETKQRVVELSEMFQSKQKEYKILQQEKELKEGQAHRLLVQSKLENSKKENRLIIIIFVISLVLFIAVFVLIRNKHKQDQLVKKQREIELQQALLRMQMNPHFIFNAMSVIQSYIYDEDITNSSKFLIHFSKLMRMILENNAKEMITLEIELVIINRYLALQKMRFEDRFDFEINNKEIEETTAISIPPILIQPCIENAIEHGDLDNVERGLIQITCQL